METLEIKISGMSCGHCVGQVTKALAGIWGVVVKTVLVGHAAVSYDPAIITPRAILGALQEAGYEPQPLERVI
jgi:copper chaperone CopZ